MFVGSEGVVDRVFRDGFVSLVETIATDVRFRLDLPASLALERFYGEEASADRSRVQAIHYFAGTTQLFLSDLALGEREPEATDEVKLTIVYVDPTTGTATEKTFAFRIGDVLTDPTRNVHKARLLMAWARHLSKIADHQDTTDREQTAKAVDECREAQSDLESRARSLAGDTDVARVRELMDMVCERFDAGRRGGTSIRPRSRRASFVSSSRFSVLGFPDVGAVSPPSVFICVHLCFFLPLRQSAPGQARAALRALPAAKSQDVGLEADPADQQLAALVAARRFAVLRPGVADVHVPQPLGQPDLPRRDQAPHRRRRKLARLEVGMEPRQVPRQVGAQRSEVPRQRPQLAVGVVATGNDERRHLDPYPSLDQAPSSRFTPSSEPWQWSR